MDSEAGRVERGELRDLIATLLYEHDPMCGHQDCEHTARKITPDIFEWFQDRQPTPDNGLREALAFYRDAFTDGGEPTRALLDDQGATALAVLHPNTRFPALQPNTGERDDA